MPEHVTRKKGTSDRENEGPLSEGSRNRIVATVRLARDQALGGEEPTPWLTGVLKLDWTSWVGLGDGSRADEDASGFAVSSRSQLSDRRGQQHTTICVVTCVTLFNQKLTPLINQSIVTVGQDMSK